MSHIIPWSIPGADDQPILGDCHLPAGIPRGVVLIAHGFKGYKDYGMFPRIAQILAGAGFIAHRFNFSHSGMTNTTDTFERPDLFEQDTWNKQVADYRAVIDTIADARLDGTGLKFVMFGHSRGGVSSLLTAGRHAGDVSKAQPSGVATASAPNTCNYLPPDECEKLLQDGFIVSPSSRTGQDLRVGKAFLTEQQDDPVAHDLLALVRNVTCPMLIMHGDADPAVPVECATSIATEAGERGELFIIEGADHVFNTPNPLPAEQKSSDELKSMLEKLIDFAGRCCV